MPTAKSIATLTTLSLRHAFGGIQRTSTEDALLICIEEIFSDSHINTINIIFSVT